MVSSRGQPFTLAVGETKTLEVPISFPPLKFGNYTLTYSQSDETRTGSPALITIPNTSTIALSFDKPSYRIRETANLVVDLKNTGKFHQINMGVTANIPDMGFTQTEMVNLPQSQGQSVTFAIPISEGIGSGSHLVQVTVTLPAEESEIRTTYLEIPSADVKFSIGPSFYRTGDTVTVSCVNAGGVDSNGSISIKLYDFTSTKMLERQGEGVVSAGDSWDFSFDLPLDLVSGPYVVEGEFIDGRTGKVYSLRKSTSLEGVGASLSVEADKEIYLAPDIKNALARIIPVVPVPIQGNLHLKASLLKPWFAEGDFPEESVVDPIGTTGGDPENLEDDEAKLLYGHPSPWTSFSTVQIDGSNYRLGIDYYPYQSPVFDEENHSLITEWRLSSLRVLQRQSLVYSESTRPDVVQLDYLIRNEDTVPREVGLRIMLDTQLGENDGAPFYIPQFGNITQEREFGRDEVSAWLSLDDLSKPSVVGKGILKGLGATPPDRFVIASWDDIYDTAWDYAIDPEYSITDDSAVGIWWNPLVLGPGEERRITTFYGVGSVQLGQVVWERSIPVDLNRSGEPSVAMDIPEGLVGKFSLQGRLYSSSGQIISQSLDPFYIMPPQTILTLHTDKSYYRPGEEVRVAGEVKNLAGVGARNLNLTIRKQGTGEPVQQIYEESFDLGAGLGRGFSFTIPTPSEGVVALIGEVKQNESPLVEITDQYVVTLPKLSWEVTVPTVVSGETFTLNVNLYNEGHVTAAGHLSIVDEQGQVIGEGDVSIPAGESRLYQYGQQITSNKTYSFSLTGDLEGSETRSVYFGLAASLVLEAQRVYPEGRVGIPLTIRNTGSFDETLEIQFLLNLSSQQKTKEYFLPRYESITDTLYFDLPEGDYQITANSQVPSASAQASFYVRKENQAELAITFGPQTEGLLPVSVNLQNAGSNEISGNVSVSVSGGNQILWTSQQAFSNLSALGSQPLPFNINPSAFPPGDYVLQVEVFNNGGQLLGMRNTSFKVSGPVFQVTPVPASGTFYPGEEGTFTFKVKNVGNQEGAFDLHFKSYDLIDLTRREWLKAGEEKSMDFSFLLPLDLEEKDYFATYRLQSTAGGQASPGQEGQVKYRLAGINLRVSAALDKQLYQEGEMAHLTLSVSPTVPLPSALNLFARVNYPGFESNQPFALASSQILPFDVPLAKITGEKLFFGIYHESGRSLHLNSLYIHKAGDVLTITTDKQVYSPGETISVSVTGNVSGNLTLSAPNYEEAISFPGTATRSFILPSAMTAGTYYISYQLS
ncbi:MAG: hypothetical protein NTV04_19640, partial [Deltaproteobacteria bacterium]|nr:hypothetical protein [Deltaproteobacteria bacterium]